MQCNILPISTSFDVLDYYTSVVCLMGEFILRIASFFSVLGKLYFDFFFGMFDDSFSTGGFVRPNRLRETISNFRGFS